MEKGYEKIDKYDDKCVAEMAMHYKEILRLLGENPDREGLLKSPERIAKAMLFLTLKKSCVRPYSTKTTSKWL